MKVATYNVNSIRQRLPIVLDWIAEHKPDVMCLQETKVQDQDFPVDAIQKAGYHVNYRGMKGYNGVATLTRTAPEKVVYGLHTGPDNEDFRVIQTVVDGIPIINSYVPQGYSISSENTRSSSLGFSAFVNILRRRSTRSGQLSGLEI
jgi:exodeoxyribonuclease-3